MNIASRIAEYARPGEVLVSQEVVDASAGSSAVFREIGPVELKGVAGVMRLHAAHRPAAVDQADLDRRNVTALLDRIDGASEDAARGRAEAEAGEGIPLEDL